MHRRTYFNPECPYLVLTRVEQALIQSLSQVQKLGEPKNMAKYTQVYAGELVVLRSDNGGDLSSHNCQMLCEIVNW